MGYLTNHMRVNGQLLSSLEHALEAAHAFDYEQVRIHTTEADDILTTLSEMEAIEEEAN